MAPLHTSHCTNSKHHIGSTPTEAPLIPPFCVRMGGGERVVKGREDRRRKKEGGTKRVEGGAPNAELGSKGEGDFLFAVILYSTPLLDCGSGSGSGCGCGCGCAAVWQAGRLLVRAQLFVAA